MYVTPWSGVGWVNKRIQFIVFNTFTDGR